MIPPHLSTAGPRALPAVLRRVVARAPARSRLVTTLGTASLVVSPAMRPARDVGTLWAGGKEREGRSLSSRAGGPLSTLSPSRRLFSLTPWRRRSEDENDTAAAAAARQRKPSPLRKALAATAHENIYTLPNLLTFSRLLAAPFVGYCVLHDHHAWALGLFAYAGITDLLDGWIARRWNLGTVVGTVIDPMADKTLMTILTVTLAVKGALPIWLAVIILGRDVGLAISAIYYRWVSLPPPKTFARYWDFSLPSAEVHPTTISKYNTALQLGLVGLTTMAPLVPADLGTPLTIMQYIVATTTIWSGASYIYSKDAVKILSQPEIEEKRRESKASQDGKPWTQM